MNTSLSSLEPHISENNKPSLPNDTQENKPTAADYQKIELPPKPILASNLASPPPLTEISEIGGREPLSEEETHLNLQDPQDSKDLPESLISSLSSKGVNNKKQSKGGSLLGSLLLLLIALLLFGLQVWIFLQM